MPTSISSLTRLLYAPIQAFLDSQVLTNRQTRKMVQHYTNKPDFVLTMPYQNQERTIQVPALTMAHVPSLSHRRMKVQMYVCTKRVRTKRHPKTRTVFRVTRSRRRNSQYRISFTIESAHSSGLHRLQEHCAEHIATRTGPSTPRG